MTTSTVMRRRLPVDVVARGQSGMALVVDERNRMGWVRLTPWFATEPWRSAALDPGLGTGLDPGRARRSDGPSSPRPEWGGTWAPEASDRAGEFPCGISNTCSIVSDSWASSAPAPRPRPYPGNRENALSGSGHVSAAVAARARPTSSSRDQLLPLLPALAPLFPRGGLQRGGVVAVGTGEGIPGAVGGGASTAVRSAGGGTTLGFALLAAASAASWCAAVGTADPGLVAFAELGVDLGHLVLVPRPGPLWAEVAATLLDGMDVVLVRPPGPVRPGVARRLAARVRERRGVLVVLGARGWPEGAGVRLTVETGAWQGVEAGHGHLQGRHLEVLSTGRRAAARPVRVGLWLPAPSGRVVEAGRTGSDGRTGEGKTAGGDRGNGEMEGEYGTAARRLVPRHP